MHRANEARPVPNLRARVGGALVEHPRGEFTGTGLGRKMNNTRSPSWYRAEAARLREQAITTVDSTELRDSYLALALQYERLAAILEKGEQRAEPDVPKPRSRAGSGNG